jgi:hypothetical protein
MGFKKVLLVGALALLGGSRYFVEAKDEKECKLTDDEKKMCEDTKLENKDCKKESKDISEPEVTVIDPIFFDCSKEFCHEPTLACIQSLGVEIVDPGHDAKDEKKECKLLFIHDFMEDKKKISVACPKDSGVEKLIERSFTLINCAEKCTKVEQDIIITNKFGPSAKIELEPLEEGVKQAAILVRTQSHLQGLLGVHSAPIVGVEQGITTHDVDSAHRQAVMSQQCDPPTSNLFEVKCQVALACGVNHGKDCHADLTRSHASLLVRHFISPLIISGNHLQQHIDLSPVIKRVTISGSMDPVNMKPWTNTNTEVAVAEEVKCQIATEEIDVQCGDMVRITLLNEGECDAALAAEIAAQSNFHQPAEVTTLLGKDGVLGARAKADFNDFQFEKQEDKHEKDKDHDEDGKRVHSWSWEEETLEDHHAVGDSKVRQIKVLHIRALNVLAKLEVEDVCEKIARSSFNPAKSSANSCGHKWSDMCCAELQNEELIIKDISEQDRLAQLLASHQAQLGTQFSGLAPAEAGSVFKPLRAASVRPAARRNPF